MSARHLVLVRHAEAQAAGASGDQQRPLSRHGRTQAAGLARQLAQRLGAGHMLCSSARRTRETADIVQQQTGWPEPVIETGIYEAAPATLLALLREQPDTLRELVLIGHNPGMEAIAAHLAGRPVLPMGTASAALFEVHNRWRELGPECSRLITLVRP